MKIRGHTHIVIAGRWNVFIIRPDWFIRQFPKIIHSEAKEKFPVEFMGDCFRNFGESVGERFGGDVSAGVSACNKFPTEFRSRCFSILG